MSERERCPRCGAPIPAGAAEGLCPRCLLAAGMEDEARDAGIPASLSDDSALTREGPPAGPGASLAPGQTFGEYRIERLLGRGGWARSTPPSTSRPVAAWRSRS